MRSLIYGIGVMSLCALYCTTANASSVSISPTRLEMTAPQAADVITLRNVDKNPVNVQIRVFRWSQVGGVERLEPTADVVASPPATRVAAGSEYLVRVVRVSKAPVAAEESYRVLVDEIPDPARMKAGTVSFNVRFSLPVFVKSPEATAPKIAWNLKRSDGGLVLSAVNSGDTRLKLSDVQLVQGGRNIADRKGLVGYVLGRGTMQFPIGNVKGLSSAPVALKAKSDAGALEANVSVSN